MPQRKRHLRPIWHAFCRLNNKPTFTMRFPFLLRATGLMALLLFTADADAQRRNGRSGFFQPQRPGALELSGVALLSTPQSEARIGVHPGLELTWIGRAAGPLHSGIRLGLGQLDREVTDGIVRRNSNGPHHRDADVTLLPEVSSVLRLDPFQGRFRPFLEGELGLAPRSWTSGPWMRTGNRTAYPIPAYDATRTTAGPLVCIQLGEGAFLTARYGERFGGHLDLPESDVNPTVMPDPLDGERSRAALGFSFAL